LPPPALPLQEGYKVLVLDKLARDVLTPLLRIKDLRSHGVTLHLPLDSPRQNIPDVPAVYLVQPTAESVDRVVQDAATGTYERFHLNFVTPLPRDLMERFADGVVRAGCVDRVASVHDQMLGFVALESGVFSLAQKDAYLALHDPKASDDTIGALINRIVDGLACVCATLGAVSPLPRPHGAPPHTPAGALPTGPPSSVCAGPYHQVSPRRGVGARRPRPRRAPPRPHQGQVGRLPRAAGGPPAPPRPPREKL